MDGVAAAPYGVLLQRFLVDRPLDRRELYWRAEPAGEAGHEQPAIDALAGGHLRVERGAVLSFDTYFNSFFESHWRRHTSVGAVVLRLVVDGEGTLRVFRRAIGRKVLVHQQAIDSGAVDSGVVTVRFESGAVSFREYGTLCVELSGGASGLVFVSGGWWSEAPAPTSIGLAAVFCTFNREPEIARVLAALADDVDVAGRLARLIVINQGRPGLAAIAALKGPVSRLGAKLVVIEQGNFGGSGGFGRGMLAALDDPAATHAALLDDDILLEPDSLLRMAAFFSFCDRDMVVGGHMLDLVQPHILYEAGAIVSERNWEFWPQHNGMNVADADSLEELSMPRAIHYSGWWLCGFPLSVVEEHGMPLPCFIRGDDVEFGLRLHQKRVPTVALPGIAVWHEPFYLKLGGWQHYYETRNLLVLSALHLAPSRAGALRRIGRQFVTNLLTFRYYTAALVLAATEAFLAGPQDMRVDPAVRHASLGAFRTAYPNCTTARETVLNPQRLRRAPRSMLGCIGLMARSTVRNAIAPTRTSEAKLLERTKLDWLSMRGVEHVAVDSGWDETLPTFRRSREHHRTLLRQAITVLPRLYFGYHAAAEAWRREAPALTSEAFWRSYLSVPKRRAAVVEERVQPVSSVA